MLSSNALDSVDSYGINDELSSSPASFAHNDNPERPDGEDGYDVSALELTTLCIDELSQHRFPPASATLHCLQ